eukprot:Sspe_Gene.52775::Locus_29222_Transcript_1_1_Confidence_1.000_Length_1257::g.52775::m.52775
MSDDRETSSAVRQYAYVIFLCVGYCLSAGLLVIVNKWVLMRFPYGANLTALQFGFSALVAWLIGIVGWEEVDPLETKKVWRFLPAVVMFYISVATNMKLLQAANVDTYIVVRACVPLCTSVLETIFLRSPAPHARAIGCMLIILACAVGYALNGEFQTEAYGWSALYILAMSIDTVLIKKVVTDVELTRWGLVFYNNFIALAFFPLGSYLTGELDKLLEGADGVLALLAQPRVLLPVIISCIVGVAISFFGLNTRKALQATAFIVLGVMNKFLTLLVNSVIWDKHANPLGIMCVVGCISGGIAYQQAVGTSAVTKPVEDKGANKQQINKTRPEKEQVMEEGRDDPVNKPSRNA